MLAMAMDSLVFLSAADCKLINYNWEWWINYKVNIIDYLWGSPKISSKVKVNIIIGFKIFKKVNIMIS